MARAPDLPFFKFYPIKFMKGVRGLSPQEVGIYMMVICRMYEENGSIDYNPIRLAAYCTVRQSLLEKVVERLVVLGKFKLSEGRLSNEKADEVISDRETRVENAKRAAEIGVQKRQQNQQESPATAMRPLSHLDKEKEKEKKNPLPPSVVGPKDLFGSETNEPELDRVKVRGASAPTATSERNQVIEVLRQHAGLEAVESFVRYRSKHKSKAITVTAARRLSGELKTIRLAGHDPDDALGMAEERGWASVSLEYYVNAKGKVNGSTTPIKTSAHSPVMRKWLDSRYGDQQ